MFWLKPTALVLLFTGSGMMVAAQVPAANFGEYGLLGAIVVIVALFLAFQRHWLNTLKLIGKSCHDAHKEDLRRIEAITENLNKTLDKHLK